MTKINSIFDSNSDSDSTDSDERDCVSRIISIKAAKGPQILTKQMILRKKKVKKLTHLSNLQDKKDSCLPHLKLDYDNFNKVHICRNNFLFSKAHGSPNAEVYCLQEGITNVKYSEDWRNCTFLASKEDGWVLFLKEDGRSLFYLQVGSWTHLKVVPRLPELLSPRHSKIKHNGWRATFSHDPRNPMNVIVIMGLVQYYNTGSEEIVILCLGTKRKKWMILRKENNIQLPGRHVKIIDGVVSGPVLVPFNDQPYICWVSSGDRLHVITPTTFKAETISKFHHGELPVSLVVTPGREQYIYLYQFTEIFNEPPLVVKIRLPDLATCYIRYFPSTFYMIEYAAGYAEDDGWSEEVGFRKGAHVIEYDDNVNNFTESSDDEDSIKNNDDGGQRIIICDKYSEETQIEESSEASVNKGEEEEEEALWQSEPSTEEEEEEEEEEVLWQSEPSKNGFFASSRGHHIVNYEATEEEALWQQLKPHHRCRDNFAFSSQLIQVSDASSSTRPLV